MLVSPKLVRFADLFVDYYILVIYWLSKEGG